MFRAIGALVLAIAATPGTPNAAFGQAVAAPPQSDLAVLLIRVLEGESAVHGAGSRVPRALTVQVTGETGQPLEGVAVSFRFPDSGPSGVFTNGLRTALTQTDSQGRASAWDVRWSADAGPVQIRVTAAKGAARAGSTVTQYISANTAATPSALLARQPKAKAAPQPGATGKWVAAVIAAAGAAAGGAALAMARSKQGPGATAPAAVTASQPPSISVGPPTITIGAGGGM